MNQRGRHNRRDRCNRRSWASRNTPPSAGCCANGTSSRPAWEAASRGAVFKALDRWRLTLPGTYRYVALKILHAGGECSEQALANLTLEFHAAQVLSHRNILNVFELDRDEDVVFSTMELLDGELLSNVLERLGPNPMRQYSGVAPHRAARCRPGARARSGIVDGDFKPRNIFITRDGEVWILGFGGPHRSRRCRRVRRRPDATSPGTLAYASCEQLEVAAPIRGTTSMRLPASAISSWRGFTLSDHGPPRGHEITAWIWWARRPRRSAVESAAEGPVLASRGAIDQCAGAETPSLKQGRPGAGREPLARAHAARKHRAPGSYGRPPPFS